MKFKIIDCLLLILYCGFIYWLSSHEKLPAPMWFSAQDKLYHAGAYGIMGVLAWRCFRHVSTSPIILALTSIAFCSLYGASDEWHQFYVPGRSSSVYDWVADTIGAMISVYCIGKYTARMSEQTQTLAMADCAANCINCDFHDQHTAPNSKP